MPKGPYLITVTAGDGTQTVKGAETDEQAFDICASACPEAMKPGAAVQLAHDIVAAVREGKTVGPTPDGITITVQSEHRLDELSERMGLPAGTVDIHALAAALCARPLGAARR